MAIVGCCVLSACAYGIIHDQITARICVEYFTVGHARIIASEDPTVLGLLWGVIATWWVGLGLGVALALAARAGSWPQRDPRSLIRPVAILLLCTGLGAAISGLLGHELAERGVFQLVEALAARVPREKEVAFLTAGWAHGASYAVGLVGGLVVVLEVLRRRYREALEMVSREVLDPEELAVARAALVPSWARSLARVLVHLALLPQLLLTYLAALLSTASVAGGPHHAIAARLAALLFAGLALGIGGLTWRWQIGCARAASGLCSLLAVLVWLLLALSALGQA